MDDRRCLDCGTSLAGRSPRAKYCSGTCRTRATKARKAGRASASVSSLPGAGSALGAIERRVVAELSAAQLDSSLGQMAALAARQLDQGHDGASAMASLMRRLEQMLETLRAERVASEAQADVDADDPIAWLARRAEERAARRGA